MKPIVAIIGRPNVGKSMLFNKLIGNRVAIVEDTPGVTRDRIYGDGEWLNHKFTVIDTGGIEPKTNDIILSQMRRQAEIAVDVADVIVFVTDIKSGVTAADKDIAAMLRKSCKPIVLACNKCDAPGNPPMEIYEFYNLGLGEPFPVSAVNSLGFGDLLDEVTKYFSQSDDTENDINVIRIAVIGRPNAGKSSLVNRILGDERVIVSDIPGTTRDAIDIAFEKDGNKYIFTDTAGLRKRGKIDENIERYSTVRTLLAIDRSDVVIVMIDANEGVTEQDTKIAGYAHDNGKGIIVAINKWDTIEKETNTMKNYQNKVREGFNFMMYAPVEFISAKNGTRIDKLFELIHYVNAQNSMRIQTGVLNEILNQAILRVQPPSDKGKRLKIYYITQVSIKPPTFVIFVNNRQLAHFSYIRYIENQLREAFGMNGTPIKFIVREKEGEK